MIKRILCGSAALLAVFTAVAQKRQVTIDRVVAVVGSSSILSSEVDEYARELVQQRREQGYTTDRDPRNEALEQLLTQKLLYNQALIDSVAVDVGGVSQRAEQHLQALVEEAGGIAELETRHHMPIFNIREMWRQRYEEQAYAQTMQSTVVSKIRITPGEVERFYKQIDPDSLPVIPEQYVYAQITKFPSTMKEAKQRTRERLLEMRERIIQGEARFDVMARMYSLDGSAIKGGDLDPQPLNGFDPTFAAALEELKPGQVSEVVETQFGYHLIELIDQKGRIYHARHIVLRPTYAPDELAEPSRLLDSIARLIRRDSITFEKAALDFSDDAHSKMNGGIVTNHDLLEAMRVYDAARYTETRFLREDFGRSGSKSLDDYNALRNLQVGEVSSSYQTEDLMGNQLSKIVKLVRVIPPHTASLEEDYIRIEQLALQAKQERVLKEWLSEKIDGMYLYLSPELRDGEFQNKHWIQ